jgi:hypothetical protein
MSALTRLILSTAGAIAMVALSAACLADTHYTFQVVPFSGTAMSNRAVLDPSGLDFDTFASFGIVHGFDGSVTQIQIPGWFDTFANDINNSGTVVGSVDMIDDSFNLTSLMGFIRKSNGSVTTYLYPGSAFTQFDACNDAGTVLGEQFDANFNDHQFLLDHNGRLQDLNFPGFEGVLWTDFNDDETLLSSRFDPAIGAQVGLLAHGSTVETFTVPGASSTIPVRINNRGEVAGSYTINHPTSIEQHGFVRDKHGRVTTIDFNFAWPATEVVGGATFIFAGSLGTTVSAINDHGQVLGFGLALYIFRPASGGLSVAIDGRNFIASPDDRDD